ncbi:MAG: DUF4912 domain-containing protein [Leptolyngbyaceae cyanobacterium RU_5_1]|nr:DUF4912 domain-containing protein [Leptolyngbyaceae cyanobacterium RU_5_1]
MSKERPPLEEMTLRQLRRVASEYGVSRYSRMRKDQLLGAIQDIMGMQQTTAAPERGSQSQEVVEAAKFDVGQDDRTGGSLAAVDEGLPDLPDGYGESRIVLMPRDPQWAYAYWDISNEHKQELRRQGGQQIALRIYDVTDVNLAFQAAHSIQEYPCDEMAREWYLPIPVSDRDYVMDIGYRCADGRWLLLARSAPVRIPPIYPSDWIEDYFLSISWDEELRGQTFATLTSPGKRMAAETADYDQIFGLAEAAEAQRRAGSLYGSMQQVPGSVPGSVHVAGSVQVPGSIQQIPGSYQQVAGSIQHVPGSAQQAVSSYVLASGIGMWAVPGVPTMSGVGMTMSGVGMGVPTMSGVGMMMSGVGMSGVGFSASLPLIRPRKFWLVADAELIVYGATEPDATVTIGGRPVKLNPDGTFRFQMSFQDGLIDYPIMAVAADGEQMRSIHMMFNRETPERYTNTKEEAVEEWLA